MSDTQSPSIDETCRSLFEAARRAGDSTQLEDFLPDCASPTFLPTLEELIHIDLEMAWKSKDGSTGEPPPTIETYLQQFPAIYNPDIVKRLVCQEFRVRHKYGDRPGFSEYQTRFPELQLTFSDFPELATSTTTQLPSAQVPSSNHRYQLIDVCGEGGFGSVWRATDTELEREVAIKELHDVHSEYSDARSRFVQEAKITAKLDHPGVVPIHDLDLEGSSPRYTMKLIRGGTLADAICEFHQLPQKSEERSVQQLTLLNSFVAVCRTIEFAHSRNIIHRDLKPANISLGEFGETLVLDWGLAKDLQIEDAPAPSIAQKHTPIYKTQIGDRKGTPAYMSPEQVTGENDKVDQRSDIYSLGVILYELLAGRLPLESSDVADLMQMVVDEVPRSPRSILPSVPRPLAAICMKALAKSQSDRYHSVQKLREDLERFLADEPVTCYRETLVEQAFRWSKRHRAWTMAIATSLITVTVASLGVAYATAGWRAATEEADEQRVLATQREEGLRRNRLTLTLREIERTYRADPAGALAKLEACPVESRDFAWGLLHRLTEWQPWTYSSQEPSPRAFAISRPQDDGLQTIVIGGSDGSLALLAAETGKLIHKSAGGGERIVSVAISNDATQAVTGDEIGNIQVWSLPDCNPIMEPMPAHQGNVNSITYAPNGSRFVTGGELDGIVKLWDASSGDFVSDIEIGGEVAAVTFRSDHQVILGIGKEANGEVHVWNVEDGSVAESFVAGAGSIQSLAYDERRQLVAVAGTGWLRLFTDGGKQVWEQSAVHVGDAIYSLAFLREQVASAGMDGKIRLWNLMSGELGTTLHDPSTASDDSVIASPVLSLATNDNETVLYSAAVGGMVRAWRQPQLESLRHQGFSDTILTMAQRPGTEDIYVAGGDPFLWQSPGEVHIWKPGYDSRPQIWLAHPQSAEQPETTIKAIAFSGRRDLIATASADKTIRIWDANTLEPQATYSSNVYVESVAFTPDEERVVYGTADGTVHIVDLTDDRHVTLPGKRGWVLQLGFLPHTTDLMMTTSEVANDGTRGGKVITQNINNGRVVSQLDVPGSPSPFIAISPDGTSAVIQIHELEELRQLASCDPITGDVRFAFDAQQAAFSAACYSPDGKTLASADETGTIKLWDTMEGKPRATLTRHNAMVRSIVFLRNGRELLSGDDLGVVIHWKASDAWTPKPVTYQSDNKEVK